LKQKQVKAVIDYVNNDAVCKSVQLLSYFGETKIENCGICSVCIPKIVKTSKSDTQQQIETILNLLAENELSSRGIVEGSTMDETALVEIIKLMLEKKLIEITPHNTYKLI